MEEMDNRVRGQEKLTQSLSSAMSMTMVSSTKTWPLGRSLHSHTSISPVNQRISHLLFKPTPICMESICGSETEMSSLSLSLPPPNILSSSNISYFSSSAFPSPSAFEFHLHRSYLSSLYPITLAAKSMTMGSELFASTFQQFSLFVGSSFCPHTFVFLLDRSYAPSHSQASLSSQQPTGLLSMPPSKASSPNFDDLLFPLLSPVPSPIPQMCSWQWLQFAWGLEPLI